MKDPKKIEKEIRDSIAEVKKAQEQHEKNKRWYEVEYAKGIIIGLQFGLMAMGQFEEKAKKI